MEEESRGFHPHGCLKAVRILAFATQCGSTWNSSLIESLSFLLLRSSVVGWLCCLTGGTVSMSLVSEAFAPSRDNAARGDKVADVRTTGNF